MINQEPLNFYSTTFGDDVIARLHLLDHRQLLVLLGEVQDEVEAAEIGLQGSSDRDNTSYLIARRRAAKCVQRHVAAHCETRFGPTKTEPAPEHLSATIARLNNERRLREAEIRAQNAAAYTEMARHNAEQKTRRVKDLNQQLVNFIRRYFEATGNLGEWSELMRSFNHKVETGEITVQE